MNTVIENFLASFPFAETTKERYRRVLAYLIQSPDLEHLEPSGLLQIIQRPKWGNSQQHIALCSSQKFLRWRFGSQHPALAAKLKRIKPKPRRSLTVDKALELLASFNPYTPIGARDLAIASFGLDTGFRREELCSMQLANVDFSTNKALTLCKGGQYKFGAFSPETAHIIESWLQFRKPRDGVNNLFVSIKTGKALTGDGMGCIFKAWSKAIGFHISPHDLRSSFATLSTIYGAPSRTLQLAGRWATIEMVEHYTGNLQLEAIRPHLPMHHLKKD
jgi:integrase/recombinase XerC